MNKRIVALLLLLLCVPALAQVNPGTTPLSGPKGGTSNAWMQFAGPTSSTVKTYTLPNTSGTVALLNVPQTWTAAQSFTDGDAILLGATSGSSVLHAPATTGGNVTFFTGNDTVLGVAAAQTPINKTFDCNNNTCTVRIANDVSGLGTNVAAALGHTLNAASGLVGFGGSAGALGVTSLNGLVVTSTLGTLTIPNNASAVLQQTGNFTLNLTVGANATPTIPSGTHTLAALDVIQTWNALQSFNDSTLNLNGATSGAVTLRAKAIAGSSSFVFPTGATDLSASGGANQVVQQTSAGGALSVGQLSSANISDMASAWVTFTPSFACGSATITNNSARSKLWGKTLHLEIDLTITAIGSCTQTFTFNLPSVTANSGGGMAGREFGVSGKGLVCSILSGGTSATCSLADFTSFQVNAHGVASGVVEIQ